MATQGPNPAFATFSGRVRFLADGRPIKPWTEGLVIPAGTRARMLKGDGIPPTYEMLVRMMRVESVSLSWLLGASVPPYLVHRTLDDAETSERLNLFLSDEHDWRVAFMVDGERAALLLHQPAAIDVKSRTIDYTATELIAGPVGEKAMARLREGDKGILNQIVRISPERMRDVYNGMLGTYQFFGSDKQPGMLDDRVYHYVREISIDNLEVHNLRVAEGISAAGDFPRAIAPLARWWPMLTDAERDAITTLLEPVIENAARRLHGKG